ncbi:AAA family ATPase [Brachybacterium sp. GCM10030252]|uniref:AAA family ATPase n=1 Tax=Brachybacterium sp. GCM10030252 TaxID=3273380 RepID=UPI0036123B26
MYGLAGSGKTTLARHLEDTLPAVRFTLDEWMLRLYPSLALDDPAYGESAAEARKLIWSVAEQVLRADIQVVLDWNAWSVSHRSWALERAVPERAEVVLHRLTTSLEESTRRAQQRRVDGASFVHLIDRAGNEHLASPLEEPSTDEGLQIVEH